MQSEHVMGLLERPVGVSLKADHYAHVLETRPAVSFFEVHAENYMMPAGSHHRFLEAVADQYAVSLHGVGMSLGSADGLDADHLARFQALVERYDPELVSEHLAWSVAEGHYLNDLLPLPLNVETLDLVSDNVARMQDAIGRRILVENPSSYMGFADTTMEEPEFLAALSARTGCGLLLDVNNIVVSAHNMGWSAQDFIKRVPASAVGEIHLAGHLVRTVGEATLRLDDHGSAVSDEVWSLYETAVRHVGAVPTLVEWDNNLPGFETLMAEADKARAVMNRAIAQKATPTPRPETSHA